MRKLNCWLQDLPSSSIGTGYELRASSLELQVVLRARSSWLIASSSLLSENARTLKEGHRFDSDEPSYRPAWRGIDQPHCRAGARCRSESAFQRMVIVGPHAATEL